MLNDKDRNALLKVAQKVRHTVVEMTKKAGGGYTGRGLSVIDILVLLFFKYMNVDPKNPNDPGRDRLVLSKGYGAIGYIPVLAERGFFKKSLLNKFDRVNSLFGSAGREDSGEPASSLGYGLGLSVGMAIDAKTKNKQFTIYCILNGEELNKDYDWEAAEAASSHNLTNLIVFVDRNSHTANSSASKGISLEALVDKWESAGWKAVVVKNGNDICQLSDAIDFATENTQKPVVIIANTLKAGFMEGQKMKSFENLSKKLFKQKEKKKSVETELL